MTALHPDGARWTLDRLRTHALTAPCPEIKCGAPTGQRCINALTGQPLGRQPAHDTRLALADTRAAAHHPCPRCDAHPHTACRDTDGRALDPAHPDHPERLQAADIYRPPLTDHDLAGWPHRMDPDAKLARGRIEVERRRHQLEQRRRELNADARAGDLDERRRAELINLDALLDTPDDPGPEPPPDIPGPRHDPDDQPDWHRGPRR